MSLPLLGAGPTSPQSSSFYGLLIKPLGNFILADLSGAVLLWRPE